MIPNPVLKIDFRKLNKFLFTSNIDLISIKKLINRMESIFMQKYREN